MEKKENRYKRLTIAELKSFSGFEGCSEEQAEETIKSLERISILFFELFRKYMENIENKGKGTIIKINQEDGEEKRIAA